MKPFDFDNRELEPDDTEGHKELRDLIRRASERSGSPYVSVKVFNEEQTHNNSITMTSMIFEIVMNSLINAYVCTEDEMALNLLQTVHNVLEIHASLASMYAQYMMKQAMEGLDLAEQQDFLRKIKNSGTPIPDAILKAFDEMNDSDK